ncbi:hypothetical protein IQ255_27610 [Pleurocapsales cyanobacterium LEGE 10410]|nr:hypothetical protein [Pleurocapsales cyanobacterium LEGE 10410]
MQPPTTNQPNQQQLACPQLPLAVYREVAAHLRQVTGVDAKLIMRPLEHDPVENFDYYQSQVSLLQIIYTDTINELAKEQVTAILDYYAQRYSPWEVK